MEASDDGDGVTVVVACAGLVSVPEFADESAGFDAVDGSFHTVVAMIDVDFVVVPAFDGDSPSFAGPVSDRLVEFAKLAEKVDEACAVFGSFGVFGIVKNLPCS